jgi:hypothetical protein
MVRYVFFFVELDVLPFNYETETGDDDIPTLNDILAASFVNVRFSPNILPLHNYDQYAFTFDSLMQITMGTC